MFGKAGAIACMLACYEMLVQTQASPLVPPRTKLTSEIWSTYVDVRRRASTYVDLRRCTSTYADVRRRTSTYVDVRGRTWTYVDVRRRTWTYVDVRGRTSTYVPPGPSIVRAAKYTKTVALHYRPRRAGPVGGGLAAQRRFQRRVASQLFAQAASQAFS